MDYGYQNLILLLVSFNCAAIRISLYIIVYDSIR
jgi:hypothetical protein